MGRTKIPIQGHPKKGGTVKKFMVLFAILASLTTGCSNKPEAVCNPAQHRVQPGETIFQIVDTYCDGHNIMPVVDDMVDLYGTNIRPWQVIIIPAK